MKKGVPISESMQFALAFFCAGFAAATYTTCMSFSQCRLGPPAMAYNFFRAGKKNWGGGEQRAFSTTPCPHRGGGNASVDPI